MSKSPLSHIAHHLSSTLLSMSWLDWARVIGLAVFFIWALVASFKGWQNLKIFQQNKESDNLQKGIFNLTLSLLCIALFIKTGPLKIETFGSTSRPIWSLFGICSFLITAPCATQSILAWIAHKKSKSTLLGIGAISFFLTALFLF